MVQSILASKIADASQSGEQALKSTEERFQAVCPGCIRHVRPNVRQKLSELQPCLDECDPDLLFGEESSALSGIALKSPDGGLCFGERNGEAWKERLQDEGVVCSVGPLATVDCLVDLLTFSEKELAAGNPIRYLLTLSEIRERRPKTIDCGLDGGRGDCPLQAGDMISSGLERSGGCARPHTFGRT